MKSENHKKNRTLHLAIRTIMQIFNVAIKNKNPKRVLYIIGVIAVITSSCTTKMRLITHHPNMEENATLIVIAYPQEVVRTTESFYSKLLPLIGMGIQGYIRAGHASMVLIKDGSDTYEHFDLGRYMAPEGYARVRGVNTDPETYVDIKAEWDNGKIANIEELLRWLYDNPKKTRGYGDIYASISESVNYERVKEYVKIMQDKGVVRYGPFDRKGSNCTRFVADAMLNGILDKKTQKKIKKLYTLSPSVLSNVKAANSYNYYFIAGKDSVYTSTKKFGPLERKMFFDGGKGYDHIVKGYIGTLEPPTDTKRESHWQWLGGLTAGAWYAIEDTHCSSRYKVSQYCANGELVFSALFETEEEKEINLNEPYQFDYPSHYDKITLKIGQEKIVLSRVK